MADWKYVDSFLGLTQLGSATFRAFASTFNSLLIDESTEKIACFGQVLWTDGGTHDIEHVSFYTGTLTATCNSTIDMSLQDIDFTAGPVYRPDEVQDQVSSFTLSTLSANTWTTKTLSSTRSVANGELLAVVWEFNAGAGGRLGSDAFRVQFIIPNHSYGNTGVMTKLASVWGASTSAPNVVFTASDGTLGTLHGSMISRSVNSNLYNSGSTPDEYAIGIKYPFKTRIAGAVAALNLALSSSNFDMVMYGSDSSTVLGTISFDANVISATASIRLYAGYFSSIIELEADTLYYLSVKPTTTNNITIAPVVVSTNSHLAFWHGTDRYLWTRSNEGAWSATDTIVPPIFPIIKQVYL